MKLAKKEVKNLKRFLTTGILTQMTAEHGFGGYELVLWDAETREQELFIVDRDTKYIPDNWHAGISNSMSFKFGDDLTRTGFASEEAKRKVRDMFPEQAKFITWAWYN